MATPLKNRSFPHNSLLNYVTAALLNKPTLPFINQNEALPTLFNIYFPFKIPENAILPNFIKT